MVVKFIEKALEPLWGKSEFDPSQFDDPFASSIKWTPVEESGASFCTHDLIEVDDNRFEFKASFGARCFSLVFVIAGLACIASVIIPNSLVSPEWLQENYLIALLTGFVFVGAGCYLIYRLQEPITLDTQHGYFWKGWREPHTLFDKSSVKSWCRVEDIHALQILAERIRENKSSYVSYELNLVLKDKQRINVVDHGNLGISSAMRKC